jgi:hypothetical protein
MYLDLLIAGSSSHGTLVAPNTRIPSCELLTPCICTRNSVLMRLALSLSPSELRRQPMSKRKLDVMWAYREPHRESISSMKMIAGLLSLAISNNDRTRRSLSPCHLLTCKTAHIKHYTQRSIFAPSLTRRLRRKLSLLQLLLPSQDMTCRFLNITTGKKR